MEERYETSAAARYSHFGDIHAYFSRGLRDRGRRARPAGDQRPRGDTDGKGDGDCPI